MGSLLLSPCPFFFFSILIVIYSSSVLITHQMLSRHFRVFFFSLLFPASQQDSLYHPFWSFCFSLCGSLAILLFPPSVNAVIAVRGSIGRDGERWKENVRGAGREGEVIFHLLQAGCGGEALMVVGGEWGCVVMAMRSSLC